MRATRGNLLLVVLAVLAMGTSVLVIKHPAKPAPYDGPQAKPYVAESHVVYPQVAFLGDSYTGGSGQGGNGQSGWPQLLAGKLTWYPRLFTEGGTGYVASGSNNNNPFSVRMPQVVDFHPDVVIVWASRNDMDKDAQQVGAAAQADFAYLHTKLPQAKIVVIGPTWVNGNTPTGIQAIRETERQAAQNVGLPFIDPVGEGWFDGQYASLIGTDGVHPTDAGHRHLFDVIFLDLQRLGITSTKHSAA